MSPNAPETPPTPEDDGYLSPIGETLTQAIVEGLKSRYGKETATIRKFDYPSFSPHDQNRLNIIVGDGEKILDVYLG